MSFLKPLSAICDGNQTGKGIFFLEKFDGGDLRKKGHAAEMAGMRRRIPQTPPSHAQFPGCNFS